MVRNALGRPSPAMELPKVTVSVSATHARMMSTESLRIVRAMKGS